MLRRRDHRLSNLVLFDIRAVAKLKTERSQVWRRKCGKNLWGVDTMEFFNVNLILPKALSSPIRWGGGRLRNYKH